MKVYRTSFYQVISPKNDCALVTYSETIEGLREEIDRTNAKAVSLGYKAEQFMIIRRDVCTVYENDGTFVSRAVNEAVVELYPLTSQTG